MTETLATVWRVFLAKLAQRECQTLSSCAGHKLPTFADECSRRLAPVKSWVSSRFGVPSACHSSQTCRRRIPCRWQPPCRPPCRAVQRHRVRRARLPKVMARAAAAVGVVRVSGFDVTRARWCPSIVPSSHGQRAALRERATCAYSESVETCLTYFMGMKLLTASVPLPHGS